MIILRPITRPKRVACEHMSPSLDPASVAAGAALAAVLLKLCGGGASSGAGDAPEPTAAPRMSRAEEEAAEAAALAAWAAEDAAEGAAAAASAAPAETAPRSSILCVGLNPAYQKSMQFKQLTVDAVNRAEAIHFSAGGKGQHCAVAANLYVPGCAEVVQFLGDEGPAGPFIVDYMRSKRCAETALTEWVPGMKTRMCTTLLYGDQGAMTELIDPSETIPMHHVGALKARLMSAIVRPETRAVCVCGTFPPGVGPSLYAEIAAAKLGMGIHGAILVIDAYKGIGDALSTGACDLLKINAAELHALIGGGEAGVEGLGREEVVLRADLFFWLDCLEISRDF